MFTKFIQLAESKGIRLKAGCRTALRDFLGKARGESLGVRLVRGGGGAFAVCIAGAGLLFGLHILLARVLGAEQYGIFAYVTSWLAFLVLPSKMGLDSAFVRFLPDYKANEDWGRFRGVIHDGFRFTIIFSLGVAGVLVAVTATFGTQLKPDLQLSFFIGAGVLPFMALFMVSWRGLQALQHVVVGMSCSQIIRPLIMAALIGVTLLLLKDTPNAPLVMVVHLLAYLGAWLIALHLFFRTANRDARFDKAIKEPRQLLGTAAPLLAINVFFLLNAQAGAIITGVLGGTTEAGIFVSAMRIAQLLTFGLMGVNAMVAPMISQLYATRRFTELQRITVYAACGISAFTIPIAFIMVVGGPWLLGLFGPKFSAGYPALIILATGQAVNALAGSVGFLMTMTGHQNQAAVRMGCAAVINIVLCCILVPRLGATGAAIGTATGTAGWNILLYFWVRKHMDIDPTVLGLRTIFR